MTIDDFDISIRHVEGPIFECLIKNKQFGPKFGALIHTNAPPTPPWVLHQFTTNYKNFFIEVETVVTPIQ